MRAYLNFLALAVLFAVAGWWFATRAHDAPVFERGVTANS
jgi:hypothetical protein